MTLALYGKALKRSAEIAKETQRHAPAGLAWAMGEGYAVNPIFNQA
ncbi:hypothetical protein ACNKHQ_01235 [Shigella flexneri]